MQLAMIGLGRMGANMVRRLLKGGHDCVVFDEGVPTPVLTTAVYERFSSRGNAAFQGKLLSAMRYQFGGHLEKPAPQPLEEGAAR
jgi:6-phosphogluconate dehydrogenase (decarboxylating)